MGSIEIEDQQTADDYYICNFYETSKKEGEKPKLITKIKCQQKVALQWIQNALDEARKDFKEIGRPLTITLHESEHASLLSDLFDDGKNKSKQLGGLLNLMALLLIITNIKNVCVSLDQHGFQITTLAYKFAESKVYAIPENY